MAYAETVSARSRHREKERNGESGGNDNGRRAGQRHTADKVPTPNIERIYSTTVPADELARALADHFRAQEFEAQVSALAGTARLSMTDSYAVYVAPGEDDLLILASVLALDLAIDAEPTTDRRKGGAMQNIQEAAAAFLANKRVAVTGVSLTLKTHGSVCA